MHHNYDQLGLSFNQRNEHFPNACSVVGKRDLWEVWGLGTRAARESRGENRVAFSFETIFELLVNHRSLERALNKNNAGFLFRGSPLRSHSASLEENCETANDSSIRPSPLAYIKMVVCKSDYPLPVGWGYLSPPVALLPSAMLCYAHGEGAVIPSGPDK
jgi:hypothetical protein